MRRRISATTIVVLSSLAIAACDKSTPPLAPTKPVTNGPTADLPVIPKVSISSISPTSAVAGSADVTLAIMGSNYINGTPNRFSHSVLIWHAQDGEEQISTTFISSEALTAVIPARLLTSPGTVQVMIENGDVMAMGDGLEYPKSNAAVFSITKVVAAGAAAIRQP